MKTMLIGIAATVLAGAADVDDGQGPRLASEAVHIPLIRSSRALRVDSFRFSELFQREIERVTPSRVVASSDEAGLILDATLADPARATDRPTTGADTPGGPEARTVVVEMIAPKAMRRDACLLEELLVKTIERETLHRVVGSDQGADLVLRVKLTPGPRADR